MFRLGSFVPPAIVVMALAVVICGQPTLADPAPSSVDNILVNALNNKGLLTPDQQAQLAALLPQTPAPPVPFTPTFKVETQVAPRFSTVQSSNTTQPFFGVTDDRSGGDGFALNRARFVISGDGSPNTSYYVMMLADEGISSPLVAVAQVLDKNWKPANIAAGQLCPPYGFEAIQEESDLLVTDVSAMTNCLVPAGGYGVRLLSKQPLPGDINYMVTMSDGKGKCATNSGDNHSYQVAGRFDHPVDKDLSVALDVAEDPNTSSTPYQYDFVTPNSDPYGLAGAFTAGTVTQKWVGADAQYHKGADTVWAEYTSCNIDSHSGASVNANAGYIQAIHAIPSGNDPQKVELVAGYQRFDPNTAVKDQFDLSSYTVGVNVQLNGSSRYSPAPGHRPNDSLLRFNYVWNQEAANPVHDNKAIVEYQNWF